MKKVIVLCWSTTAMSFEARTFHVAQQRNGESLCITNEKECLPPPYFSLYKIIKASFISHLPIRLYGGNYKKNKEALTFSPRAFLP